MERKRKELESPFGSSDRPEKRLQSAGEDNPKDDADQAKNGKYRSLNPVTHLESEAPFDSSDLTTKSQFPPEDVGHVAESMERKRKEPASPFGSSDGPEKRLRSAGEDVGHVAGARGGYRDGGPVAGEGDEDVMVGSGVNDPEERNDGESDHEVMEGEQDNGLAPEVARQQHPADWVINMGDGIAEVMVGEEANDLARELAGHHHEAQGGNDGYDHHIDDHHGEIDQQLIVGEEGNGIANDHDREINHHLIVGEEGNGIANDHDRDIDHHLIVGEEGNRIAQEVADEGGSHGHDINVGEGVERALGNRVSANAQLNP